MLFNLRNTLFILFAFVLLVNALPTSRHQFRRSCNPHPPKSSSSNTEAVKGSSTVISAKAPKSTSAPGGAPTLANQLSKVAESIASLFPISIFTKSWSTSPLEKNGLPLADSTFRPTHVLSELSHPYVAAPDGKKSMQAHYPAHSYNFDQQPLGGFSFYAPGPASVDVTTAKEVTFGYSVYFPEGFDYVKGGKLPGVYGGDSDEEAVGCSGGRRSGSCFSARLMWRTDGAGEFYTYLPPFTQSQFAANEKECSVKPVSICNPTYGASVGRGSFSFATGKWTTVTERVRLNDVGQANGQLELFVNGDSVINVDGLILRDSSAGKIRGLQMQTFFGGSTPDFATPKDQDVYFSDFSLAVTETL